MKITSITARAVDCGFKNQALQTSRVASPMSRFPRFGEKRASWMWPSTKAFIRIETDTGHVGWSCTNGGEIVAVIVNQHLSRLLDGQPVGDLAELWEQMFLSLLPCDRSGFSMMAVAAVDIALWDLAAKAAEKSLLNHLGGGPATVPTYMTTSRPEAFANRPFHGLKAAAPFGPEAGDEGLAANVDYMARFREAAGPDAPVMVDAFMAWDSDYTLRFLDASAHLNLHWVEDPLPPYDLEGLRHLRANMDRGVRLALGNFAFNRWDCAELLREGLVDVLQPDIAWAGGITEGLRILDMARDADVPVILHNTCEQPWAIAMASACQGGAMVECVDRGETSPLYALMGPRAALKGNDVVVPDTITGNCPPDFALEHFTPGTHAEMQDSR